MEHALVCRILLSGETPERGWFCFFFFFFCWSGSGCTAANFWKLSNFSEPIKPCWESNRTCQPDHGRGVKHQSLEWERGGQGSGSNARPPVRELARWTTRPHRRPECRFKTGQWNFSAYRHWSRRWHNPHQFTTLLSNTTLLFNHARFNRTFCPE